MRRLTHKCFISGLIKPDKDGNCRLCLTEYARKYRKDGRYKERMKRESRLRQLNKPLALKAKDKINYLIRHKGYPRASVFLCVDCGKQAKCYDHRDYSKPFEVEPVCISCNSKRGPALNANLLPQDP